MLKTGYVVMRNILPDPTRYLEFFTGELMKKIERTAS
jgi:hypothetical protein